MSMSSSRRFWFWLLLGVVAILATGMYWRFGRSVDVVVVPVQRGSVALHVSGPGTVQARSAVTLGSRLSATVVDVLTDVGETLKSGQLLVVLDDRDAQARLAALRSQQSSISSGVEAARAGLVRAQAELALAQSRQRRDEGLRSQGFLSEAALDASESGVLVAAAARDSARAALAAREADARTILQEIRGAEATLSHTRVTAPMDALVVQRLVERGSTVSPGFGLLKLIDPATLWIATRVDESVIDRVAVGQDAEIRLRSGQQMQGQVTRLARQSDAATRELEVFVTLSEVPTHIAIDQEAAVTIMAGRIDGLVIPASALVKDKEARNGVLVVEVGRTVFRPVRTEGHENGWVRVIDGLEEGEVLVRDGQSVRAGQRVFAVAAPPPSKPLPR